MTRRVSQWARGVFWTDQRGVALVVTLAVISLLVAAGMGVFRFVGSRIMTVQQNKDMFQAEQWALSGIHFAMMVLDKDAEATDIDSVQEPWADAKKMTAAANAVLGGEDLISLRVTDELSKVQINALIREFPGHEVNPDQVRILERLFSLILAKARESDMVNNHMTPMALVNALTDWLDSGDDEAITGLSGGESMYYEGLDPPYSCANAPLCQMDEICNIKGMDCALLASILETEQEKMSLEDLCTVHGLALHRDSSRFSYPGRININTAPLPVLEALMPQGMEKMALDLAAFRGETTETGKVFVNTLDKGWYKKVIGLSEKEQKNLDRVITYETHIFRVESSARKDKAQVNLTAFVRRYPTDGDNRRLFSGINGNRGNDTGTCLILQIQRNVGIYYSGASASKEQGR